MNKKTYTAPEAEIEMFNVDATVGTITVSEGGVDNGGNNDWDFQSEF